MCVIIKLTVLSKLRKKLILNNIENILSIFDVNTTIFTILNYPMSYIEFFGTLLNILSVYLVAKNKIWTWPIGNIAVVLFAILFFQIQLYSDFFEQIYFFITGFYGWWVWWNIKKNNKTKKESPVTHTTQRANITYAAIILVGTLVLGFVMSHINEWLPTLFTMPASFPYLDAFTTVMSFAATIMMANKKLECWYLWILVDIIGIGLYFSKGVIFISLLYVIFLVLATKGLLNWRKLVAKTKS